MLVCNLCAVATPFVLLPPLFFLTGASGSGKTTLYQHLVGHATEAILIDQDLLWGLKSEHDDAQSNYRQFRGLVLHLAERLARNGRPVMIEGTCTPEQYEDLGERWYFSHTAYLAVVCDDAELEHRLTQRPAWRRSHERVADMVALNQWFRAHAATTTPPITLLDTTGRTVDDCAREVHAWLKAGVDSTVDS
jgi:predicted kinase